jgi:hypothetical protein
MDRTSIGLEVAHAAAVTADAATTYNAVGNCTEANPIIGQCGRGVPIPVYFMAYQALHTAIVLTLPPGKARTIVQAVTLGTEAHAAYRNVMIQSEEGRLW